MLSFAMTARGGSDRPYLTNLKSNTMNTKDTLHITLNGSTAQRTVMLRRGKAVLVSVTGNGEEALMVSDPLPANLIADHRLKVNDLNRKIEELEAKLAKVNDENERLKGQKAQADELLLLVAKSGYTGSLIAAQDTATAPARTEIEASCFNSQCNVELIKRKLDDYIANPTRPWQERFWCIVWQLFTDLSWWKRESTLQDFVDWVTQSGHALTIDNFKHAKIRLKTRLLQWHSPSGDDDFAVTARALDHLFTGGGGSMPGVVQYETAYVDHTALKTRIRANATDKRHPRTSLYADKGMLRCYVRLQRRTRSHRFAITEARRSALEALGISDDTEPVPGLRYTVHTGKSHRTLRKGRGPAPSKVPRLR